jgi:UDP-glucose 4-epimerase
MRSFLVTGGAGFIGSHLVEELLRRGHRVRVVDDLSTGKRHNLDAARTASGSAADVDVVIGDLADPAIATRAVDGMDVVLHQAAIPSVPKSIDDPLPSHRANIDATVTVLVAASAAGVKRVVFAGSSAEYGDTPMLPKHEDMALNPLSPYALQKVVGEQYLQQFTRHYAVHQSPPRGQISDHPWRR